MSDIFDKMKLNATKKIFKPVSVWCPPCRGTGFIRRRKGITWTLETCRRCKGFRRIWVEKDSDLHIESQKMIKGLWPSIRKEKGWLDDKFVGVNKYNKKRYKKASFKLHNS